MSVLSMTSFALFSRQGRGLGSDLGGFLTDVRSVLGWRMPALLLLMVIVAVGEGASMALLLPLLSAVGMAGVGAGAGQLQVLVSHVSEFFLGQDPQIQSVLMLVVGVFFLQGILFVGQVWWVSKLQRSYGAYWQRRLFDTFIHARWSFFSSQKTGHLVNALTGETARLAGALYVLLQLAATILVTLVYLSIAAALSWRVTLALVVFALCLFLGVRGIGRRNYRIGRLLGPLNAQLSVLLTEFFGGVKLVKATATEHRASSEVGKVVDALCEHQTWATFLPGLVRALFEFLSLVALCVVLVIGHEKLGIPAAQMILILALFVRLIPRFNAMQQNFQLLATYLPALTELRGLLEEAQRRAEVQPDLASPSTPLQGAVSVDIRRAGYEGITILHDIKLDLPLTGFVGVVGESGAGKSTLVHCLLGLVDIADGTMRVGAVPANTIPPADWRRVIGYVPQETILFHLSVRDNIAWAKPDATLEEIRDAARRAYADEFIEALPEGYDSIIGDHGLRLSGGQRQRLGIARALLTRPSLLLLDEATSALDSESERAVLTALDFLRKDICIVSVAHRLSSVRDADLILVMDKGTIADAGSWSELMSRESRLRDLVQTQNLI